MKSKLACQEVYFQLYHKHLCILLLEYKYFKPAIQQTSLLMKQVLVLKTLKSRVQESPDSSQSQISTCQSWATLSLSQPLPLPVPVDSSADNV